MAVNETPIRTYAKRSLNLNLGLRREFSWIFIVADVHKPILGADFLRHFGLLVDMAQHRLIDTTTHLLVLGIISTEFSPNHSITPKTLLILFSLYCLSFPPSQMYVFHLHVTTQSNIRLLTIFKQRVPQLQLACVS